MSKLITEQLSTIIEAHSKWLNGESSGQRANLFEADLSGANLFEADLSGANLSGADLSGANLSEANLFGADLSGANLFEANLSGADLSEANLSGANLFEANLSGANLSEANLSGANLDKKYYSVTGIGSRKGMTTYCFNDDIIWCGCFKGTLAEFEVRVQKTHKDNLIYLTEYTVFIKSVKELSEFYRGVNEVVS